jgi:tetratricopeptide (TPR) repeat protein
MLGKSQLTAVLSALILVVILYFGFEYKPNKIIGLEKLRSKNIESTGIENLILQARESLSLEDMKVLEDLRSAVDKSPEGDQKIENTKLYSSKWFEVGYPIISAFYAEEVAKAENSSDSWAISGTSYILGMKQSESEKEKDFAFNRAVSSFEKAISLDPENLNHKINLALVFVEKPLPDQPMKGIMMLRDLNSKYPENVSVIVQLARLAVKTGQWDRAQERLNEALSLDSENLQAVCLMAEVLTEKNNKTEAQVFIDKCEKNRNK